MPVGSDSAKGNGRAGIRRLSAGLSLPAQTGEPRSLTRCFPDPFPQNGPFSPTGSQEWGWSCPRGFGGAVGGGGGARHGAGGGWAALTWPGLPQAPGCCDPRRHCTPQKRPPVPAGQTRRGICALGETTARPGHTPPLKSWPSESQRIPKPTSVASRTAPSQRGPPSLAEALCPLSLHPGWPRCQRMH